MRTATTYKVFLTWGGIGLLFVIGKLAGLLPWSWAWALSPFWLLGAFIPFVTALAVLFEKFNKKGE